MKITIKNKLEAFGLSSVVVGDFFRFANGKSNESVYICLEVGSSKYARFVKVRNLTANRFEQIFITNKERYVVFLEPAEMVFADSTHGTLPTVIETPAGEHPLATPPSATGTLLGPVAASDTPPPAPAIGPAVADSLNLLDRAVALLKVTRTLIPDTQAHLKVLVDSFLTDVATRE